MTNIKLFMFSVRSIPPEQCFSPIQFPYAAHILILQMEIKDAEIFIHSFFMRGFWNHGNAQLNQVPQSNLRRGFAIEGAEIAE